MSSIIIFLYFNEDILKKYVTSQRAFKEAFYHRWYNTRNNIGWSMLADDVNALLNDKKLLLTEVYFELQKHFEQIADTINGNIGISALHLESGESISFNGDVKFPMQSVYKFPIAMVMLHEIDNDKFWI